MLPLAVVFGNGGILFYGGEEIIDWRERRAERTERRWNRRILRSMDILRNDERLSGAVGLHGRR